MSCRDEHERMVTRGEADISQQARNPTADFKLCSCFGRERICSAETTSSTLFIYYLFINELIY